MAHNVLMAKKSDQPRKTTEQYRKPRRVIGVPEKLCAQLDVLATRHASDITEEVRTAVREYLERHNLWPLAEDKD